MAPGGAGTHQRGFTITELMISVAIAGVILGALSGLFLSRQKSLGVQDQEAEMHQAARAAMDFMVREIRMLGYGMPNSSWEGCADPCPPQKINASPAATSTPCPAWDAADVLATPTAASPFRFWGNLDATRTTLANNHACLSLVADPNPERQCLTGLTTLTVDALDLDSDGASNFAVDDTIYVEGQIFTPDSATYTTHWHTARVTAVSLGAKTLTISPGLNFEYTKGSTVNVVKRITYSFDAGTNQIDRQSEQYPGEPSTSQPLAENIANFFLNYTFADGDRGLPNDADTDLSNDTSNIRTINVCLTARTPKPDPTYRQNNGYRLVTVTARVTSRNLP